MDEDFALWNFIEEERERYSRDSESANAARGYDDEDEDEDDEETLERLAEKLGLGIIRQGGNY